MNNKESADGWSLDPAKAVTHVSLCAGYGGIDLGLRRAIPNLRTVAFSEIEAFACANLVAKMEAGLLDCAPIWTDLKTFPWEEFRGKVDILSGGYPCQPFSSAGKRLGAEDPRHLWPYIADGIVRMQPRVCFFENVEGHITLGLRDVLHDLGGMGYRTTWCVASASEVGAPHQRKRVFVLADRDGERGQLSDWWRLSAEQVLVGDGTEGRDVWPSRPGEQQFGWEPPRVVGDAAKRKDDRRGSGHMGEASGTGERGDHAADGAGETMGDAENANRRSGVSAEEAGTWKDDLWRRRSGKSGDGETQPPLGRDADGAAGGVGDAELFASCDNRTDELRLLGNGVVPQTAERAWRVLVEELINHKETR